MKRLIFIILLSLCFPQDELSIIYIQDAWELYPSANIKDIDVDIKIDNFCLLTNTHITILNQIKKEKLNNLRKQVQNILTNDSTYLGYMKAGILYARNYFYDKALESFTISKLLNETNYSIYVNIGNIYYIDGNYINADKNYKKALGYNKNDSTILLNLAFLNYEHGNFNYAKIYYFTAIMLNPTIYRKEYDIIVKAQNNTPKASNKGVKKLLVKWKIN